MFNFFFFTSLFWIPHSLRSLFFAFSLSVLVCLVSGSFSGVFAHRKLSHNLFHLVLFLIVCNLSFAFGLLLFGFFYWSRGRIFGLTMKINKIYDIITFPCGLRQQRPNQQWHTERLKLREWERERRSVSFWFSPSISSKPEKPGSLLTMEIVHVRTTCLYPFSSFKKCLRELLSWHLTINVVVGFIQCPSKIRWINWTDSKAIACKAIFIWIRHNIPKHELKWSNYMFNTNVRRDRIFNRQRW